MKKHFKGGKIDFGIGLLLKVSSTTVGKVSSIFLLTALLFSSYIVFPQNQSGSIQIPINGFCKYRDFKTNSNYTTIFSFNYNNDSYSDILLYSPLRKKINILTGDENGDFSRQDSIKVPYQFSSIQKIFNREKETESYAFASRRDRTAGIFQISNYRKFSMLSTIQFTSYPENISAADINGDGRKEILISGSAFDGLSVLYQSDRKLIEKKVEEKTTYTAAIFVDLNNDDIPDIAGFNLITNSLDFFYNYGNGTFNKIRSIPIDGKINAIHSFDINSDDYEDLIFVKNNSIVIFYGDFRSSFENTITLNPLYHPDKVITGDFNKDGKIDIAYINYDKNILSIILAKGDEQFYPEIIYLKKNDIKDIIPFYSKFINGIAGITFKGDLFTLTRVSSFSEDVQITLASEPSAITFFDKDDDGIIDFCFLDQFTNSLIAVIRNSGGIPKGYYSFPLFQEHSLVTPFNISPNVKGFYCYSYDKKLIEALVVDFNNDKIIRKSIYSHGGIMDLKAVKDEQGKVNIFTAYRNNDKLGIDIFRYSENNYSNEYYETKLKDLASNITLGLGKRVSFWQKAGNELLLFTKDFSRPQSPPEQKFSLSLQTYFKIVAFTGDLLNNDKDILISFLTSRDNSFAVITTDKTSSIIRKDTLTGTLNVTNKDQFFLGEMRINGLKKLFIYYPDSSAVHRLDFLKEGKEIISTKAAAADELNHYFIKNMNVKNYHIVYTRKNESQISINKISQ